MSTRAKLRTYVANAVPPAFSWMQDHGLYPDPDSSGHTRRIGRRPTEALYSQTLVGYFRPAAPLSEPDLYCDNDVSSAYHANMKSWGHYVDVEWPFGYYDVPDVKIWPDLGVHASRAGNFIDVYCSSRALRNPKYELPRKMLPMLPAKQSQAGAIFMAPSRYHNFYHWMIDIIPRLQHLGPALDEGLPVVVPAQLRPHARRALRLALDGLGYAETEIRLLDNRAHQFKRLILPTNLVTTLDVSAQQRSFLRSSFMRDTQPVSPNRRLYVSRRDAHLRRVANEEELAPLLRQRGFETVTLGNLDIVEQASLFANAEVIISHHGAGLTNLAFCSPGTLIVEIHQNGFFACCFARLAQLGELKYGFLVGEPAGVDTIVNPAELADLLDRAGC